MWDKKGVIILKEKKYIDNLFKDDLDFEGGLLNSLLVEPPKSMHDNIMSSLKPNIEYARRFSLKRYLYAAAAVFIFTIGAGAYLNKVVNKNEARIVSKPFKIQVKNVEKNTKVEVKNTDKKVSVEKQSAKSLNKTSLSKKEVSNKKVQRSINNNLKNEADNNSNAIKNQVTSLVASDKFSSKTNMNNIPSSLSQAVILYQYEVICKSNNTKVIDFINNNSQKIAQDLYAISIEKFEELNKIISEEGLLIKKMSDVQKDNAITIKLIIE
ncbi:hypothetical protein SAMN05660865_01291 [Caloramator fervidus]|uniref:Uncharacterized protein n=1 Tax=Caloramator fervidus TaxID=29344 RepID=A0A1H5VSA5_9CLOT|nr:hypothetical protein SAMN05660865_01291 [Caloramator fervidus]